MWGQTDSDTCGSASTGSGIKIDGANGGESGKVSGGAKETDGGVTAGEAALPDGDIIISGVEIAGTECRRVSQLNDQSINGLC